VEDGEEQAGHGGDETPPELAEQRFAANLREARESRGMSQYALAQEMHNRGWPWRQQTVTRVETGQRMVRLGEATAIAEILRVPLDRLIQPTGESRDAELLSEWIQRAQTAFREIISATAELITTRDKLSSHPAVTAGIIEARSPQMRELIVEAETVHSVLTPKAAIEEAARLLLEGKRVAPDGSR
jgi:transcriptional regulator with XRE-family HTH domain